MNCAPTHWLFLDRAEETTLTRRRDRGALYSAAPFLDRPVRHRRDGRAYPVAALRHRDRAGDLLYRAAPAGPRVGPAGRGAAGRLAVPYLALARREDVYPGRAGDA